MICKGHKTVDLEQGIIVTELDTFLQEMSSYIWDGNNEIWTIKINDKSIDFYLTKAQREISCGEKFEDTEFYAIIKELLEKGVKLAMWYDTYCEELPLCGNIEEVMKVCYNGILDSSGICEVYFRMR